MIRIYVAILLVIIVLAVKLIYDLSLWYRREIKGISNKTVKHTAEWWKVFISCLPSIILFGEESSIQWWFAYPISAFMIAFFIWLFFDGIYNIHRGYNWFYTGSVDADDAKTDKALRKMSKFSVVLIKFGGLAFFIFLYLKFYK